MIIRKNSPSEANLHCESASNTQVRRDRLPVERTFFW
jgi:hypothetical protein